MVGYIPERAVAAYEVHRAFAAFDPVGEGIPEHWGQQQRSASGASRCSWLLVAFPVHIDWVAQRHSAGPLGALNPVLPVDSRVGLGTAAVAAAVADRVVEDIEKLGTA